MDEEVLQEAEEEQIVETMSGFSGIGSTEGLGQGVRQVTLMELPTPVARDTVGAKLLSCPGRKEGQGIAPKVWRKAAINDAVDNTEKTYLVTPADSTVVTFTRRNDSKGLRYVDEDQLQQGKESEIECPAVKKNKRNGNGFGVGVLNDDGDDGEDPYEIQPKSTCNRVIGGQKKKAGILKKPARHVSVSKKVGISKAATFC